ncbi:hypothetical protein [Caldimonas tepidiphila]|uniref:hypothetical protein n=1 Tax=Caldimonas tepidiphila TaxID=2315841 RepID=UPI000E5A1699|nr:hypothetical protein [Caldimonas tepidiphila]
MLTSLLGVLHPRHATEPPAAPPDFADTVMLESPASAFESKAHRRTTPMSRDLIVRGTTADDVCRQLLGPSPGMDGTRATRRITLFDLGRHRAKELVRLLADASGEPLERLYLRRQDTLSTMAVVERTALPRRFAEPLQVAQVEVRSASLRAAGIPLALLGRSHLSVVMLAPLAAAAVDQVLALLRDAVQRSDWSCPNLLIVLDPADAATVARVRSMPWPASVNVEVCAERPGGASALWNHVLRGWNRMKLMSRPSLPALTGTGAGPDGRTPVTRLARAPWPRTGLAPRAAAALQPVAPRAPLDQPTMLRALEALTGMRGVLGAAVADSTTGLVLGRRLASPTCPPDLDQAAVTLSEVLKAHRRATLEGRGTEGIEEVLVTQSCAHQVLRTLSGQPQLFLFVVLDRADSNLALARHAIAQAEKTLI